MRTRHQMLGSFLVPILIGSICLLGSAAMGQQQIPVSRGGETTVAKQAAGDKSNPLLLQADDLIYDNRNNRVIAHGKVEIYYNDYVLLADEVIYDRAVNTLTAVGNVRMREPDGAVVN